MPHTIRFQSRKVIDYVNNNIRYLTKEKRFETQEETIERLLKIKGEKRV